MAILLGNTVWEGLSTEPRPTYAEGARDGHFYKELDTGETYIRRYGVFEFVNLGLSFIKATKSGTITTDANGFFHVSFVTPFINNLYSVALGLTNPGIALIVAAYASNRTISGFDIVTLKMPGGQPQPNQEVSWLATRDYNP